MPGVVRMILFPKCGRNSAQAKIRTVWFPKQRNKLNWGVQVGPFFFLIERIIIQNR